MEHVNLAEDIPVHFNTRIHI